MERRPASRLQLCERFPGVSAPAPVVVPGVPPGVIAAHGCLMQIACTCPSLHVLLYEGILQSSRVLLIIVGTRQNQNFEVSLEPPVYAVRNNETKVF